MGKVGYKNVELSTCILKEPQIPLIFESRVTLKRVNQTEEGIQALNVLSLFSGCGGMDLGFEGGFPTLLKSINEKLTPNFIERKLNEDTVLLKKNKFRTIFANDILQDARNGWINYFTYDYFEFRMSSKNRN